MLYYTIFSSLVSGNMFASSSFYAKGLHPTVEDQVELARRISSSLSDISNKSSKGQTMYVNRKKRSVKWVHEGEGTLTTTIITDDLVWFRNKRNLNATNASGVIATGTKI